MAFKKVLDYDPLTRTTQYFHANGQGNYAIETVQDVSANLRENAEIKSYQTEGWSADMHHVARIPLSLYESWWREFGGDPMSKEHKAKTIAKLNSRDYSGLRTKDGNI